MTVRSIYGHRFAKSAGMSIYRAEVFGQPVWVWKRGGVWDYGSSPTAESDVHAGTATTRDKAILAAINLGTQHFRQAEARNEAEAACAARGDVVHRGVVITLHMVEATDGTLWFGARAGGRSAITRAYPTTGAALSIARCAIDSAEDYTPEKYTLWLNDSIHWKAAYHAVRPLEAEAQDLGTEALREALVNDLEPPVPAPAGLGPIALAELLGACEAALACILKHVPPTTFAPRDRLRAAIAVLTLATKEN